MRTLEKKFIYAFIISLLTPVVLFGITAALCSVQPLRNQVKEGILRFAEAKVGVLESRLDTIADDAEALVNTQFVRGLAQRLVEGAQGEELEAAVDYSNAYNLLQTYQEKHSQTVGHVFLTDNWGRVVLSPARGKSGSSRKGQNISGSPFFEKSIGEPQIADPFLFPGTEDTAVFFLQPVITIDGNTLGVLAIELRLDSLAVELAKGGDGLQVVMITAEGEEIRKDSVGKIEAEASPLVEEAIEKGAAFGEFTAGDGERQLVVFLSREAIPWVLGVRVAEAQAYQALGDLYSLLGMAAAAIVIISVVLVYLVITRVIEAPLAEFIQYVKLMGEGDRTLDTIMKRKSKLKEMMTED